MHDPGDAQFAGALYDRLSAATANMCLSPFSVRLVFALCYLGARGRTADELRAAFRFGDPEETKAQCEALLGKLAALSERRESPVLRIATRLWAAAGRSLLEDFAATAADAFGAPLEQLDFKHDPEGSRAKINSWVEQATERKIVELIAPNMLHPDTSLVATNAAYLRAAWTDPFAKEGTRPGPFFSPRGTVEVPLMHQTKHHSYGELHDTQVVELPYDGGELAMRIAVPRDAGGIAGTESRANELFALPLERAYVDLVMPRFRCESRFMLESALAAMGVASAFRPSVADFSGIDGTRELYVSCVVHQVFVDVNETGTEAAAATALLLRALGIGSRPPRPIPVRIDRPFLFWIVHPATGTVLFAGRVVDPSQT